MQSDTLVQILLTRTHADVKIRLREGITPVNYAEVKIGEVSLVSNSLGLAKFLQLPVDQNYHYSITKEAYVAREGTFLLASDTTIDVSMEKLSSGLSDRQSGTDIHIWPNPTSGLMNLRYPMRPRVMAQVMDLNGLVVLEFMVEEGESHMDISMLPGGMYILHIPGKEGSSRLLISKL